MPLLTFALASVGALLLMAAPSQAASPKASVAAASTCPATFQVLHNDYIGAASLPKGRYQISILNVPSSLSCSEASTLFARFLQDFDGKLPGGWKVKPGNAAGRATFKQSRSGVRFRVRRGGGGGHVSHRRCGGTFQVEHNDQIGALSLPAGPYWLWRLNTASPQCPRISTLFAKFLEEGNVSPNWRLNANQAKFIRRGTGGNGFRIKPAA